MKPGYINAFILIVDYNGTCFNLHSKYNLLLFLLWLFVYTGLKGRLKITVGHNVFITIKLFIYKQLIEVKLFMYL